MPEMILQITNTRKNTPMDIPDGHGGLVHIDPTGTTTVRGDFNYFRRAAKEIGGLTVKVAPGGSAVKVDHDYSSDFVNDIHKVKILNYRDISMRLATGVDRQHVEIPRSHMEPDPANPAKKKKVPGEITCVARVSLVKQMSSIKVIVLDDKEPTSSKQYRAAPPARAPSKPTLKVDSEPDLPKTHEAPVDSLETLRAKFELPQTIEEYIERTKQTTWHDLRGIAGELGFTRPKSRDQAIQMIASKLYPASKLVLADEGSEEAPTDENAPADKASDESVDESATDAADAKGKRGKKK